MKKYSWLTILTALILAFGCIGAVRAEIIPPQSPGQQIGYPAVVLCETLTLREEPSFSSKAVQTLNYGDLPIVVGADAPKIALLDEDPRLPILKEEGDWYVVSLRGAAGWIHK